MSANLDMTNGRANIAFLGSRNDVWHKMGQEMATGQTIDSWADAAGLGWSAVKVPALIALQGAQFDHIEPGKRMLPAEDRSFVVRSDNGAMLGYVSGETDQRRLPNRPAARSVGMVRQIYSVDDRFQLDVCGALDGGKRIWATAKYRATFRWPAKITPCACS